MRGSKVVRSAPDGSWRIIEDIDGVRKIQFDASQASRLSTKPLGPGRGSLPTSAAIGPDGKVIVLEGKHRLEAIQRGARIPQEAGGIPGLPGWLEFDLFVPK